MAASVDMCMYCCIHVHGVQLAYISWERGKCKSIRSRLRGIAAAVVPMCRNTMRMQNLGEAHRDRWSKSSSLLIFPAFSCCTSDTTLELLPEFPAPPFFPPSPLMASAWARRSRFQIHEAIRSESQHEQGCGKQPSTEIKEAGCPCRATPSRTPQPPRGPDSKNFQLLQENDKQGTRNRRPSCSSTIRAQVLLTRGILAALLWKRWQIQTRLPSSKSCAGPGTWMSIRRGRMKRQQREMPRCEHEMHVCRWYGGRKSVLLDCSAEPLPLLSLEGLLRLIFRAAERGADVCVEGKCMFYQCSKVWFV